MRERRSGPGGRKGLGKDVGGEGCWRGILDVVDEFRSGGRGRVNGGVRRGVEVGEGIIRIIFLVVV